MVTRLKSGHDILFNNTSFLLIREPFYPELLKIIMRIYPMSNSLNRITVNPQQCGGRPCVRGMRIRVADILDLLAHNLTVEQILEEMPDLEREDIQACLQFAARRLSHPLLIAA